MFPKHNCRRIFSGNCKNYRLLGSPARSLLNLQEQNRTWDSIFWTIILRDPYDNQADVGINTSTIPKGHDVIYSLCHSLSFPLSELYKVFKTLSSVVIVLLSSLFYPFCMPFFPDQCLIYKSKVSETLSRLSLEFTNCSCISFCFMVF